MCRLSHHFDPATDGIVTIYEQIFYKEEAVKLASWPGSLVDQIDFPIDSKQLFNMRGSKKVYL